MEFGKIFLSHKSDDKSYVEYVARKIGLDYCIYDSYTFEDGMDTIEEIFRAFKETDLFVIFLSKKALNSPWVKKELVIAHKKLTQRQLKCIYPLIIDESLDYNDPLIPKWMRERYNLRKVMSPKFAAQKIKSKVRDIMWENNKDAQSDNNSFFGRNDEIKAFEKRRSDLDEFPLKCIIASGFESIGRKKYIEHCLKKVHIMRESYRYNLISLEQNESIEDFILKVNDLGINPEIDIIQLNSLSMEDKIGRAVDLIITIQQMKEYIFINDNGVIVKPNQEVIWWFYRILDRIDEKIVFGIASRYNVKTYSRTPYIFPIRIDELEKTDRRLMLSQYCEERDISIEKKDLKDISDVLSGYPQQVLLAISMLQEDGIPATIDSLYNLRDFSFDKAATILRIFENDQKALDLLTFFAQFDFVSKSILDPIFKRDPYTKDLFFEFLSLSVITYLGSDREYIKLSDIIKDYLGRQKLETNPYYKLLYKQFASGVVDDDFIKNSDLASYYTVIKAKIINEEIIDEKYIIPSHYLKSIITLYNGQHYKEAIKLALKLIESDTIISFDIEVKRSLLTFLCLSFAREKDKRFFSYYDSPYLEEFTKKFLLGFYYRVNNNPDKAIKYLKEAIEEGGKSPQLKRELVNAYVNAEEYENALEYSMENYNNDRTNAFHIQSYFKCLMNSMHSPATQDDLKKLIEEMGRIKSPTALQMKADMEAQYIAEFDKDYNTALTMIDNAIDQADKKIYLLLSKFDIAFSANNQIEMKKTLDELEKETARVDYFSNAYLVRKARYLYSCHAKGIDIKRCLYALKFYPDSSLKRLKTELKITDDFYA